MRTKLSSKTHIFPGDPFLNELSLFKSDSLSSIVSDEAENRIHTIKAVMVATLRE